MSKQASPVTVIVALVVLVLVIGGLWYKFLGPASQPPAPPETIPGMVGQTGGASSGITEEGRPKSNAPKGAPRSLPGGAGTTGG